MKKHFLLIPKLFVVLMLLITHVQADVIKMDRKELIQRSEFIFTGSVMDKKSHWNKMGTLIVTDYIFSVNEVLWGDKSSIIKLTFSGGTVGDERISVSDVPDFSVGDKVLLMIENIKKPLISPITGMYQGKFVAGTNNNANQGESVFDGYEQIVRDHKGKILSFDELVDQIRNEVHEAKKSLPPDRSTISKEQNQFVLKKLPVQKYDASEKGIPLGAVIKTPKKISDSDKIIPKQVQQEILLDFLKKDNEIAFNKKISPRWSYSNRALNVPIVFNPLPNNGLIGNHDQYQMSYWNQYGDIFRVISPTGTWAFRNGRYDIAGFVSDSTMINQFGSGWGSSTLGVTYTRSNSRGFGIESDIALNPAWSWTVNDYDTYNNTNLHNADHTLLHEIAHAWGLDHQFNALSIENYAPHKYRAYPILRLDDVAAVRSAFPTRKVSRSDIGVSLFYSNGYQNYSDSDLSSTILSKGQAFTVSNFVIENSGTQTVMQPKIEWYLVPSINSWLGAIYIGTTTHSSLTTNSYFITQRTLITPSTISSGTYYLSAYARNSGDSLSENNSSWLDRLITIR